MSAIEYGGAEYERQVRALAAFINDLRPFWPLLVREWIGWVSAQFRTEGEFAQGAAWEPLSPDYAVWKEKHYPGKSILIRTGDMRRHATSPERVAQAQSLELIVDDDVLAYHQEGTEHMPARPVIFGEPLPVPLNVRLHEVADAYADELVLRLRL